MPEIFKGTDLDSNLSSDELIDDNYDSDILDAIKEIKRLIKEY